jgi:D-alanyl-D-alanine carboxypeptidase
MVAQSTRANVMGFPDLAGNSGKGLTSFAGGRRIFGPMNGEIHIRRHHNVRRLALVTVAAAAVVLLLKPESASGSGDGQHSLVAGRLAQELQTRIPEAAGGRATLQRIVRRLVAGGAPGAVAFVRSPGSAGGVAAGYADLGTRTPMRANDGFRIASVTKTFVATVVLELEAEHRLDIDDPVERWLPGLVPNGDVITIRELLTHTSGLFDYAADDAHTQAVIADPGRRWSPHELLSVAFAHSPLFRPGTSWFYSSTNYVVLGLVVEALTGRPLGQELQARILDPLQLEATSFDVDVAIHDPFAHGYLGPHPGLPIAAGTLLDITTLLSPSFGWGAGNMASNAADVTRFFVALLRGQLLPPAQLAEMKTGSLANSDYGLGLRKAHTSCGTAYGHEGDFPGYRNAVWVTRDGRRAADVMVNIDSTHISWDRLEASSQAALCAAPHH